MFKRRKKEESTKKVVSIPAISPNRNITPIEYKIPAVLENYETGFERRCFERLKSGAFDKYCDQYMKFETSKVKEEAKKELLLQEVAHQASIDRLLEMDEADTVIAERRKNQMELELESVKKELEELEKLLNKGTHKDKSRKYGDVRYEQ